MIDKVLCPYCGSEMVVIISIYLDSPGWVGQTLCPGKECNALGPRVTGYKTKAAAKAAALSAAQARYLPPNRPLTLEEAKGIDADEVGDIPCFVEVEPNWYEKDPDDFEPRLRADVMCKGALDCATYNKLFRIWLRKPTQAEMDAAGWGEESHENA